MRTTKPHHYDYKIGSLCFIKTPNIKSNLSPKLRPKFEGPYRVVERLSNVNYKVQHVEQLRKRFNTHVNRMIPFIKRFSYLHLNNLDNSLPGDTESPRAAEQCDCNIVRVHYFVRGGFVGHRSRASSKHLSPHLPVGSLDSSGSNRGCAASEAARMGVESTKKPTPDVVVFET
ncbi:integrase catalytic domain-containing protein [Trichonephila clavipes]|nr:integrase catalytic domain-containing protein [Trichonephila clavipes]